MQIERCITYIQAHTHTLSLSHTHPTLTHSGFLEVLKEDQIEFTLVSLKTGVSSGIGAAALGAKAAGLSVQIDYDYNVNVLYHSQ